MIKRQRVTRFITRDGRPWVTRDEAYKHEKYLILHAHLETLLLVHAPPEMLLLAHAHLDTIVHSILGISGLLIALAPQASDSQRDMQCNLESDMHHD